MKTATNQEPKLNFIYSFSLYNATIVTACLLWTHCSLQYTLKELHTQVHC